MGHKRERPPSGCFRLDLANVHGALLRPAGMAVAHGAWSTFHGFCIRFGYPCVLGEVSLTHMISKNPVPFVRPTWSHVPPLTWLPRSCSCSPSVRLQHSSVPSGGPGSRGPGQRWLSLHLNGFAAIRDRDCVTVTPSCSLCSVLAAIWRGTLSSSSATRASREEESTHRC